MKREPNTDPDGRDTIVSLLDLIGRIRCAVGDHAGALMQDELVERCRELRHSEEFYQKRFARLQQEQARMRDPERTIVCDILANGTLLPDPNGKRYGCRSER